jgi:hypothetical protein
MESTWRTVDFIKDFVLPVGVGVAIPAVIAAWVVFDKRGQLFWKNLGTFEWTQPRPIETALAGSGKHTFHVRGVRTVALVAAAGFLLALFAAIASVALRPTPLVGVSFTPHRIGPTGEQTPERIAAQGGKDSRFDKPGASAVVPGSSGRLCTISQIEYDGTGGQCALIHRGGNSDWDISVDGKASCQVTCFDFAVTR